MSISGQRRILLVAGALSRLGSRSVARYAVHKVALRTGAYVRRSSSRTSAQAGNLRAVFPIPRGRPPEDQISSNARAVRSVVEGRHQYFFDEWRSRPESWTRSATTGRDAGLDHWTCSPGSGADLGDIKWVWDPSRWSWLFPLVRAWRYERDLSALQLAWHLLEDWVRGNPVDRGPNWACGQECAIRLVHGVWFHSMTRDAPPAAGGFDMAPLLASLASRVRLTIGYALSQRNNHAVSELVGLYVASRALPDASEATAWRNIADRHLSPVVDDLIADDGYYRQHSYYYARSVVRMLQAYCWAAHGSDDRPRDAVVAGLARASEYLERFVQPDTGHVPNFGGNDGSCLLPLSTADYRDFRPALAASAALLGRSSPFDTPAAQEERAWLSAVVTNVVTRSPSLPRNGMLGYRGGHTRMYVRCGSMAIRPAHADMLHVDFWYRGRYVARDAGSFQYFDSARTGETLEGTAAHNTVVIDGADQMTRLSRFLWGRWADGSVLVDGGPDAAGCVFRGEHRGYREAVHTRSIFRHGEAWLVLDEVSSPADRDVTVSWHLDPDARWSWDGSCATAPDRPQIRVFADRSLTRTVSFAPEGASLQSEYFGRLTTRALLCARVRGRGRIRVLTVLDGDEPVESEDGWLWMGLKIN